MFLKILEHLFTALNKNTKITLLSLVLAVLIMWGITSEIRLDKRDEACENERKADKSTIISQAEELKDMRTRMFDAIMKQQIQQRETIQNDSLARRATEKALNKIQP